MQFAKDSASPEEVSRKGNTEEPVPFADLLGDKSLSRGVQSGPASLSDLTLSLSTALALGLHTGSCLPRDLR